MSKRNPNYEQASKIARQVIPEHTRTNAEYHIKNYLARLKEVSRWACKPDYQKQAFDEAIAMINSQIQLLH